MAVSDAVRCAACGRTRPRYALSPDNVCRGGCEHDDDLGQESPQMVNGQQVGP